LKEDDEATTQVAKLEKQYFHDDVCRLTVSRKLTMVSQWSLRYNESMVHGFRGNGNVLVADKKLWAWNGNCLKA
jgi:hypothetical protein